MENFTFMPLRVLHFEKYIVMVGLLAVDVSIADEGIQKLVRVHVYNFYGLRIGTDLHGVTPAVAWGSQF